MAVNPTLRAPLIVGFLPVTPSNATATLALSATTTWLAMGFVPTAATTVTEVSLFCSAVAGTLGATDLSCDIYSDASGIPNASLQTTTTVNATPTAAAWVRFSSFGSPATLVAGTQYWAVFKNANGTAASNNPTYRWGAANTSEVFVGSGSVKYGWPKVHTTNSGTAWATGATIAVCGLRIGYGDGTYDGLPASNVATNATDKVFGSNENGVRFVTPANAQIVVRGLCFNVINSTGPTGNLQMKLYTGSGASPTLQATSNAIPQANVANGGWYAGYFGSSVTIPGGTVVRCVIKDSAADSSSAYYTQTLYTMDTDANSIILLPFYDGTAGDQVQQTYLSGGTWTDTNSGIYPFGLILDTSGPFASAGGGGLIRAADWEGGFTG